MQEVASTVIDAERPSTRTNKGLGDRVELAALICLVALVYGWASWSNRAPTIFSDEAGTLGNARWFAGGTLWHMGAASASSAGYPLFLTPIFWVTESPAVIYRLAVLLNVALVAGLVGVLYSLVRRCLGGSHRVSLTAAACGVAYPAVVVQVGVAWQEILTMFGFAAFLLTALLAAKRLSPAILLTHGAIAGILSQVHGRFTVIPFLAIAGLLTLAVARPRIRWWAIGSAVLAGGLTLGLGRLQDAVQAARWTYVGLPELGVKQLKAVLPGPETRALAGQFWYLIAGTGGLIILGFVLTIRVAIAGSHTRPNEPNKPFEPGPPDSSDGIVPGAQGRILAIYVGLAILSILLLSVTYMAIDTAASPTATRADILYYGRYNECLVPTLICIGVFALLSRQWRRTAIISLVTAAVAGPALLALSFALAIDRPFNPVLNPYMVSALEPMFRLNARNIAPDARFAIPAAAAASAATLVLLGLTLWRRWLAPVFIIVIFAIIATSDVKRVNVTSDLANTQIPAYEQLESRNPRTVAYDPTTVGIYAFYAMPFWLDKSDFVSFNSSSANWPAADLVIGPAKWPAAATHGLKLVLVERMSGKGFYAPNR